MCVIHTYTYMHTCTYIFMFKVEKILLKTAKLGIKMVNAIQCIKP